MKLTVWGLWCNVRKQWYTPGRCFGNGNPMTWTKKENAEYRKKDQEKWNNLYWHYPIDLRVVEFELKTLNNNHTI